MTMYSFRVGDGNEGNFREAIISLNENQSPYAALKALMVNRYIVGTRHRKHVAANIDVDGDKEYGIHAIVHEGPKKETAYGAAWLTGQFDKINKDDEEYYPDAVDLMDYLDRGAKIIYNKLAKKGY